ncbi:winged helix-turn-helix domain-containing protein, partial [Sinomonas sp. ASV322]|uniref:winged helix-turn-helix domain-containing protein n=1 Tax=Sinomonas sp. ASV322 TaxID=3041920 RepID=UPI0027DAB808
MRAAHGHQTIAALRARPEWARCTAGRRTRLLACLQAVIDRADYETMTSRPTWAALAERVGVSRASVARYLRTLREWGLLGIVASGRTAPYASLPEDGSERTNEAAVYVVCAPAPLAVVDAAADAVDKNETPPALGGSHLKREKNPPHTREEKAPKDAATPRAPSCGEA